MEISANGLRMIRHFEGFISCPYRDVTGTWTRGIGEAGGRIGPNSKCVSEAEAYDNLRRLVKEEYGKAVNDLNVRMTQNQFDALCDFFYNCGPGAADWNVGREIKANHFEAAANDLLEYNTSDGIYIPQLAERRRAERELFLTPEKPAPKLNPLDVLYPAERRVANSYLAYMKHPKLHPHGIKVSKEAMVNFRGEIYDAATYGRLKNGQVVKKGWDINNRKARYDLMVKYTK